PVGWNELFRRWRAFARKGVRGCLATGTWRRGVDNNAVFPFGQSMSGGDREIAAGNDGPTGGSLTLGCFETDAALLQGRPIDLDGPRNSVQASRGAAAAAN